VTEEMKQRYCDVRGEEPLFARPITVDITIPPTPVAADVVSGYIVVFVNFRFYGGKADVLLIDKIEIGELQRTYASGLTSGPGGAALDALAVLHLVLRPDVRVREYCWDRTAHWSQQDVAAALHCQCGYSFPAACPVCVSARPAGDVLMRVVKGLQAACRGTLDELDLTIGSARANAFAPNGGLLGLQIMARY